MEKVDVIVVGAGAVGLAVARALCLAGRSVIVAERHDRIGEETSSRNSGVIHSSIYYPAGSAKARFCVSGQKQLYAYCEARQIPHARTGKLIVAQPHQLPRLRKLQELALLNGVGNVEWLEEGAVRSMEPAVRATAALWCPNTGIVSVHELMAALHADIEAAGGSVALRTTFVRSVVTSTGFEIDLLCDGESMRLASSALVNCAGLGAVSLLSAIEGYPRARIPQPYFAKGNYFEFTRKSPFSRLVYPMPNEAGLGIHATLDISGRLRFGPDVEWLQGDDFDYGVAAQRGAAFYSAIREYWPDLPDGTLQPAYAGIRPKLAGPGAAAADFLVEGAVDHGIPGLVNLLGIESPGLTSIFRLGAEVVAHFDGRPQAATESELPPAAFT